MKRKWLAAALAAMIGAATLLGCGDGKTPDYGDPNANAAVPSGSAALRILKDATGRTLNTVGAELDAHWLFGNDGREMPLSGGGLTNPIDANKVWSETIAPRMAEMGLSSIRMMMLPSWYAPQKENYDNKTYLWESEQMKSVYQVLDTCEFLGIEVNVVIWLWDTWYDNKAGVDPDPDYEYSHGTPWGLPDRGAGEEVMANVLADLFDHLVNTKGYTCLKMLTPVNEPDSTFKIVYSDTSVLEHTAFEPYVSLCKKIDEVFKKRKLRDGVKFVLSDDCFNQTWFEWTLSELKGVYDYVDTHVYNFNNGSSNDSMISGNSGRNFSKFGKLANDAGVPLVYGEFGTNDQSHADVTSAERGVTIPRMAVNMLRTGASGFSYWMLFGQYYNWEADDAYGNNMGLWGSAAENYECRPAYYAYSLLTRYAKLGMEIYEISSEESDLSTIALRSGDDWTYLVVNSGTAEKNVSFVNEAKFPARMFRYVYDSANPPADGKQISSNGFLTADGRVLTDTIAAGSFAVYSTLK